MADPRQRKRFNIHSKDNASAIEHQGHPESFSTYRSKASLHGAVNCELTFTSALNVEVFLIHLSEHR